MITDESRVSSTGHSDGRSIATQRGLQAHCADGVGEIGIRQFDIAACQIVDKSSASLCPREKALALSERQSKVLVSQGREIWLLCVNLVKPTQSSFTDKSGGETQPHRFLLLLLSVGSLHPKYSNVETPEEGVLSEWGVVWAKDCCMPRKNKIC